MNLLARVRGTEGRPFAWGLADQACASLASFLLTLTAARALGPSVFLEFDHLVDGRRTRCRRWLTPLDVPASVLRRWAVVLPSSGRAARS